MLHLRVVCPADVAEPVREALTDRVGVVAVRVAGESSHGVLVCADLARESADDVFDDLRALGVLDAGMVSIQPLDTAVGVLAARAEDEAPGAGPDAIVWDELVARTGGDATLSWSFCVFMILATVLGGIGVVTDSPITLVGAMVIGPEFGPLAAISVGLMRGQHRIARRGAVAVVFGFALAIVVTGLLAWLAHGFGLIRLSDITGPGRETEFIYHPGVLSLVTAIVAGIAGMVSLTSNTSAALVGVFISVTTVPAAGNTAVAVVLGETHEAVRSLANLGINLVGIITAGLLTLAVIRAGEHRSTPRRG